MKDLPLFEERNPYIDWEVFTLPDQNLADTLKKLPLEKCEYKTDPITEYSGWYAPQGFAFKITGKFVEDVNHSTGIFVVYIPSPSVELRESSEPWEWSEEFADSSPVDFVGKWFSINKVTKELIIRQNIDPFFEDQYYLNFNGFFLPLSGIGDVEWTQGYATGKAGECNISFIKIDEESEIEIAKSTHIPSDDLIALPLGVKVQRENINNNEQ